MCSGVFLCGSGCLVMVMWMSLGMRLLFFEFGDVGWYWFFVVFCKEV